MSACSVRLCDRVFSGAAAFFWSRYAVIPLAGLSRRSAGRWRPWACHATNHKNFIYQPIFTIFAATKFSNKQAIITLKMINKRFNETIWILTFFS